MQPKFIETEGFYVAGVLVKTTTEGQKNLKDCPAAWKRLMEKIKDPSSQIGNNNIYYGLCYDEAPDGKGFSYLAGFRIEQGQEVPEGFVKEHIRPNRYAVFTHKGKTDEITKTWDKAVQGWLPRSGEKIKPDEISFELYDKRFRPESLDSEIDIYLPIA